MSEQLFELTIHGITRQQFEEAKEALSVIAPFRWTLKCAPPEPEEAATQPKGDVQP